MSITELQSLAEGTAGNMRGADIAAAVNALISKAKVMSYDTLSEAVADASLIVNTVVFIKDRANAAFDVVLASSVTTNTFDFVACTGDATLALSLQKTRHPLNPIQWGAIDNLTYDNKDVFMRMLVHVKTLAYGGKITPPAGGSGFLTSQVDLSDANGIIFGGDNAIIKLSNTGTQNYIFNLTNCEECQFVGNHFIGTSDEDGVYDAANRRAGISDIGGSFNRVTKNTFEKFASFCIFAQGLNGGTYTEGIDIEGNIFRDCPYDSNTEIQAAIILSSDGEYSVVNNNRFYRVPSAVRFTDGANGRFSNNIVMQLNADFHASSAALYATNGSNWGKLQITGNKFNHIETGMRCIMINGDATKPQNTNIIDNNEFLVCGLSNGTVERTQIVVLNDCFGTRVTNCSFRPAATVSGQESIRFNRCDNSHVDACQFRGGDYAITVSDGNITVGTNNYDSQTTAKIREISLGKALVTKNRAFGFRVNSSGTIGAPWDDLGVTVAYSTDHYVLTHAFGSTEYVVTAQVDNETDAGERHFDIVRAATSTTIYVRDGAGATKINSFMVNIVHGATAPYAY